MLDRVPTKSNRYAVYDENHNFLRYEYHERADEPTQVGDALNKANLLPDEVATALGLTGNPQVKDALNKLFNIANPKAQVVIGSYIGTGTYGVDNPNSLTFEKPILSLQIAYGLSSTPEDMTYNIGFYNSGNTAMMMLMLYGIPNDDTYYNMQVASGTSANNRSIKVKKSTDGKTVTWCSHGTPEEQCNAIKNVANNYYKYFYLATLS